MVSEARKGRVLVVDDVPSITLALDIWLRREGYECIRAHSSAEALDQLERVPIDLVIADVPVPRAAGAALIKEVKRRAPRLPVIAMTVCDPPPEEAGPLNAECYLLKPFTIDELSRRVAGLLADPELGGEYGRIVS